MLEEGKVPCFFSPPPALFTFYLLTSPRCRSLMSACRLVGLTGNKCWMWRLTHGNNSLPEACALCRHAEVPDVGNT